MSDLDIDFSDMLHKRLAGVTLSADREVFIVDFADGSRRRFGVEGDCCSTSWIEHLELPNRVAGAMILSIEDSAPVTQDHKDHDEDHDSESIEVYNTVFHTSFGDIVLEYRNSSNGYYGGHLIDEGWSRFESGASDPDDEQPRLAVRSINDGIPMRCICLPDRMTLSEPPQPRKGRRDPACKATEHRTKQPLTAGETSAVVLDTKLLRR